MSSVDVQHTLTRRASFGIKRKDSNSLYFHKKNTGTYHALYVLSVCVCFLCFLPIHSGHQVRWTYQPGSHRRKLTQDFSSTFFLRCVP